MARNVKKAGSTRTKRAAARPSAKRSPAKPAKRSRKKAARKTKRPGALRRLENALMASAAEVDELAVSMGLSGAVPPRRKAKRKKTKR